MTISNIIKPPVEDGTFVLPILTTAAWNKTTGRGQVDTADVSKRTYVYNSGSGAKAMELTMEWRHNPKTGFTRNELRLVPATEHDDGGVITLDRSVTAAVSWSYRGEAIDSDTPEVVLSDVLLTLIGILIRHRDGANKPTMSIAQSMDKRLLVIGAAT